MANGNCTIPDKIEESSIVFPAISSAFGFTGNLSAIFLLQRVHHKNAFVVLVTALIIDDLFGIIITSPPVLSVYIDGIWNKCELICCFHGLAMVAFSTATTLFVCTLALERMLSVCMPYVYTRHFTAFRARITVLCVCGASFVIAVLPLFGCGQYALQYPGTWCFLNLKVNQQGDFLYGMIFTLINLTFIIIIVICNLLIAGTLLKRHRLNRLNVHEEQNKFQTTCSRESIQLDVHVLIMAIVIATVFATCWTPFMVQMLTNLTCTSFHPKRTLIFVRLAAVNQVLDPWIYVLCIKARSTLLLPRK